MDQPDYAAAPVRDFLAGVAWRETSLGPIDNWSRSLRTVVHLVMDARLPMFLMWGAERILVYNDSFARIAGSRHPDAFARPVGVAWPQLWRWDEQVFDTEYRGAIVTFQDQHLVAGQDDRWFDLFYTPVRDDNGRVHGVLCNVVDSTRRLQAEQAVAHGTHSLARMADTLSAERRDAALLTGRLHEESESLRQLFEQAPGFMALTCGPEHAFTLANRSFKRLVGGRELLGRRVVDAFPEGAGQGFVELLDHVFRTGEPFVGNNVELFLQNEPDQPAERRVLDFVYQPVQAAGGSITGIFLEGIDVTERAAAEERLRIAHEAGGIGTFEWFPATDQMITSPTYRALWGFPADATISAMMLVPLVDPEFRRLLGTATEENRTNPLAYAEFRIRRHDTGESRWLARRGEIVGDGIATTRRYVGVAFDITERKQVEEALALTERRVSESTEFIRLLLDSTEEGFYSIGCDGVTTLCNRGFLRMLGFTDESQVLGHKLHEVIHHSHADGSHYPNEACPIYLAAQTGQPVRVDHEWFYRTDGTRFPVEYRAHPIWRDGKLQGALCTFNDISERIESFNKLRVLNETLEHRVIEEIDRRARAEEALHQSQKMEAIGQLTGGVAHDFNNVLHIIGGNLQLLQNHLGGDAMARKRLDTATAAVMRGAKLSSQLLAFARRQPLQPIVINLGRLVQNMNDLLRRALGESIQVRTSIADDLWNTLADPSQIENVILNLAINSRDAMDGAGLLEIALSNAQYAEAGAAGDRLDFTAGVGEYVLLAVSDNGSGMPPEILKKAFEPFFTTKPEGEGTGLGLSMAYGFVKQSHGHIKIDSQPHHGTTIRIYLPRSFEAEAQIAEAPRGPVVGGSETILVVEDDPGVQATVVDTLGTLGYHVLKADNGESALALLRSGAQVDLLFTDVVMPGSVRSPELARHARETLPQIAVLFTSGYTQDAIVHGGRLDPGVDLLSKPYRRDQLARKIRASLENARSGAALATPAADAAGTDRTHAAADALPATMPAAGDEAPTQHLTDATEMSSASSTDAPDGRADGARTGNGAGAQSRLLVVEDNTDLRLLVCEMLDAFGYAVMAAGSAEEALALTDSATFDILLTDVRLPGMSGIDLARRVRAAHPEMHVIFTSGYGAKLTENIGFPAHSLAKPYDIDRLHELLSSLQS